MESPRGFRLRAEPGIEYWKPPIDAMLIFIYSTLGWQASSISYLSLQTLNHVIISSVYD